MIDTDLYITFVLATTLLILMPGPIVTITVANSLAYGTRHGLRTVVGTSSATALMLTVGGLGMTSAFLLLAQWFEWLRWFGAAYLVFLGLQQWRARPVVLGGENTKAWSKKGIFWQGFLISITNPKTILFYAAFFPQFLDPARDPGQQLLILSVTFLVIATSLDSCYAILCGRLRPYLADAKRGRLRNRITGGLMIGTGLALAFARKS
ncbi:MAG: LysE family translocator [Rhodospirillales bacterium]|nr:LysE family translocator [Rhodospirillales bacterium]